MRTVLVAALLLTGTAIAVLPSAQAAGPCPDTCTPCAATCPPPALAPAMADPFPTCVQDCFWFVPKGCDSRDLTTAGPVAPPLDAWGDDCDLDVEPIGACAPPSGSMVERHVGPVHLKLLLCGGDVPDWS